jgi:hypothetical protein
MGRHTQELKSLGKRSPPPDLLTRRGASVPAFTSNAARAQGPGEARHARKERGAGEKRSKRSGLRGGASSLVSFPGGREGKFINCWRLTWTLPTGMASSRLSLPSHTVMTRSVWRLERRTGNTNALPLPFDGHAGLALLYTIPVTACMDAFSTLKSERPCLEAIT